MVTYPLEDIIKLIEQGERLTAQAMLEQILASEPHNLPAWACYLKTCTTDEECIKALELCLQQNPENDQVKQELEKIRAAVGATDYSNNEYKTFATVKMTWRFLNTFLFLIAFLAPWTRACTSSYNTINGFGVTSFIGWFTFGTLTNGIFQVFADPSQSWNYIAMLTAPLIFVGLVCILLYALLYSLLNFRSDVRKHFYIRILMLLAGVVAMGSIILWLKDVNWQKTVDLKELFWGYWLTWVVLGSSVLFEIINRLSQDWANQSA